MRCIRINLFYLNPYVDGLNARDLALATAHKLVKKKPTKMRLDSLGEIKACSGLANKEDMIKRLKVHLELAGEFDEIIRLDQAQNREKNVN